MNSITRVVMNIGIVIVIWTTNTNYSIELCRKFYNLKSVNEKLTGFNDPEVNIAVLFK